MPKTSRGVPKFLLGKKSRKKRGQDYFEATNAKTERKKKEEGEAIFSGRGGRSYSTKGKDYKKRSAWKLEGARCKGGRTEGELKDPKGGKSKRGSPSWEIRETAEK